MARVIMIILFLVERHHYHQHLLEDTKQMLVLIEIFSKSKHMNFDIVMLLEKLKCTFQSELYLKTLDTAVLP